MVEEKKLAEIVNFVDSVPNKDIAKHLLAANLLVNTSRTGSLDKVVLEAMACALPILTCNEALKEVLGSYVGKLMFPKGDEKGLARKIKEIYLMSEEEKRIMGHDLREIVERDHSLDGLIKKILKELCSCPMIEK